jgi:GTP-binding protein
MQIKTAEFKKGIKGTDDVMAEHKLQVAFIGRSNVGKSSLMNCLLERNGLVKSGKTPGKTQELNFFLVNGEIYFVDLPGYGYAKLPPKTREHIAAMINWYFHEPVWKRKTVLVLDIKAGPSVMDIATFELVRDRGESVIVVANKADALNQSEKSAALRDIAFRMPGASIVPCSAKTGAGREEIMKRLFE